MDVPKSTLPSSSKINEAGLLIYSRVIEADRGYAPKRTLPGPELDHSSAVVVATAVRKLPRALSFEMKGRI